MINLPPADWKHIQAQIAAASKQSMHAGTQFHLHSPLQQANEHFSSFFESIIYSLLFAAFCFHLNSSMRNKTGTPRFLGKWSPLSQSLSGRSPADQKARGLWVRDWLTNKTPSSKSRHGKVR